MRETAPRVPCVKILAGSPEPAEPVPSEEGVVLRGEIRIAAAAGTTGDNASRSASVHRRATAIRGLGIITGSISRRVSRSLGPTA